MGALLSHRTANSAFLTAAPSPLMDTVKPPSFRTNFIASTSVLSAPTYITSFNGEGRVSATSRTALTFSASPAIFTSEKIFLQRVPVISFHEALQRLQI